MPLLSWQILALLEDTKKFLDSPFRMILSSSYCNNGLFFFLFQKFLYSCYKKLPQNVWLKTENIYYLVALIGARECKREAEERDPDRCPRGKVWAWGCSWAEMEGGALSRACGWGGLWKLERMRGQILIQSLPKEWRLIDTLTLALWDPFQISPTRTTVLSNFHTKVNIEEKKWIIL